MADEKRLKISYQRSDDYRVVAANGAVGGVGPQGDFFVQFYVETRTLPIDIVQELVPDAEGGRGMLGKILSPEEEHNVTRELQCGVLMSREQARSLAEFIGRQLEEFDRVMKPAKE